MFRLALALGKTVRELEATLTSSELTEWIAYDRIDPIGQDRADLRAGMICATISNWKRSPNQERFKPGDFMWQYKPATEEIKPQTPAELDASIDAAFAPFIAK